MRLLCLPRQHPRGTVGLKKKGDYRMNLNLNLKKKELLQHRPPDQWKCAATSSTSQRRRRDGSGVNWRSLRWGRRGGCKGGGAERRGFENRTAVCGFAVCTAGRPPASFTPVTFQPLISILVPFFFLPSLIMFLKSTPPLPPTHTLTEALNSESH